MAAVLSPQTGSASPSPTALPPLASPSPKPNLPTLPPLLTSASPRPASTASTQRAPKDRLSTFSTSSNAQSRSRPQSTVFPLFHSSLPYALVRDFAYPFIHPLHYGPPPEPSQSATPTSRLSEPQPTWESSRGQWSAGPWTAEDQQLPATAFGDRGDETDSRGDRDGPPWAEDEDLHSPVVTSAKHRKQKSAQQAGPDAPRGPQHGGANGDNSSSGNQAGGYITYPPSGQGSAAGRTQAAALAVPTSDARRRDSHFQGTLPSRSYASRSGRASASASPPTSSPPPGSPSSSQPDYAHPAAASSLSYPGASADADAYPYPTYISPSSSSHHDDDDAASSSSSSDEEEGSSADADDSRYSRDYQFTIASPDEEMHGKAVALFDFARENDNELPLAEGQVILVSYRHGQGWLVAQDPKTGESGLVPEEYVRLLRDIEGGWAGLVDGAGGAEGEGGGEEVEMLGEGDGGGAEGVAAAGDKRKEGAARGGEYYAPVVSTFSTSSRDLQPWPQHLLGSQAATPTLGGAEGFGGRVDERKREGQGER